MTFKFFFFLILYTAILSAAVYGIAQKFVEHYINIFSFALLGIIVFGIAGMMRTALKPSTVKS